MSQLILMVAKIDDLDNPEILTEVWRRAMPMVNLPEVMPEHYLNGLESTVTEVGWEAMRHLLVEQWRLTDNLLVERFRGEQAGLALGDGYDPLKVASRLGVVYLPRQVCYLPGTERPPGISATDWERVVQARQTEPTLQANALRRLGPQIQPDEVVASVDEIVVRRPEKRRFLEWGTACVRTTEGYRYLSGNVEMVLRQLFLLLLLCGGNLKTQVVLLGDGARWIMRFFQERLASWPRATLFLDWYHCHKKCYDLTSQICRGRKAKAELLGLLLKHLWRGQVQEALDILEEYRPQARNIEKLEELINYPKNRQPYIPNYRERRAQQQYIGSAHVEKGNDLIVARRQKHQGMHWSSQTSDALAALRTLLLNGGWDLYWQKHQVLPLAIQVLA